MLTKPERVICGCSSVFSNVIATVHDVCFMRFSLFFVVGLLLILLAMISSMMSIIRRLLFERKVFISFIYICMKEAHLLSVCVCVPFYDQGY